LQATVVVCCTEPGEFGKPREGNVEHALVFWNLKDAFQPEGVLTSTAALLSFDINPFNPTLVVAGCADGQVVVWETAPKVWLLSLPVAHRQGANNALLLSWLWVSRNLCRLLLHLERPSGNA
jgi:hypothetical protein